MFVCYRLLRIFGGRGRAVGVGGFLLAFQLVADCRETMAGLVLHADGGVLGAGTNGGAEVRSTLRAGLRGCDGVSTLHVVTDGFAAATEVGGRCCHFLAAALY